MTRFLLLWLRGGRKPARRLTARRRAFVPRLDQFEDRTLLNTYTVTNLADSGTGSLRQAVLDANAHHDTDQIVFAPGLQGTIALTSGQLNISDGRATQGAGIDNFGSLTLSQCILSDNQAINTAGNGQGGGIMNEAGA